LFYLNKKLDLKQPPNRSITIPEKLLQSSYKRIFTT